MRYRLAWNVRGQIEPKVKNIDVADLDDAKEEAWKIITQGDLDLNVVEEVSIYDDNDKWIESVGL